jgi:cysteine-rich repeat protein
MGGADCVLKVEALVMHQQLDIQAIQGVRPFRPVRSLYRQLPWQWSPKRQALLTLLALLVSANSWVGCGDDSSVSCSNELEEWTCPDGLHCHDTFHCVFPSQIEACEGLADGYLCTADSVANGVCSDGVCVTYSECGDAIVDYDLGEVCDDGNQISGDGCSADCQSDESCGNGYADVAISELCDDNDLAGESCAGQGFYGGTLACLTDCS